MNLNGNTLIGLINIITNTKIELAVTSVYCLDVLAFEFLNGRKELNNFVRCKATGYLILIVNVGDELIILVITECSFLILYPL